MKIDKELEIVVAKLHQQKPLLVEKYKVESLGIFGSFVRHERKRSSDLDLLVSFVEPPSLLTFIEMENYLTDLLGVQVDLVMREALRPRIGRLILKELMPI
jgi:predicted nucleotidyltransferase